MVADVCKARRVHAVVDEEGKRRHRPRGHGSTIGSHVTRQPPWACQHTLLVLAAWDERIQPHFIVAPQKNPHKIASCT
jgi:hypothetical protein